jgi:hypothetical protein
MCLADVADERVCAGHHNAPAHPEQEQKEENTAEARRARQGIERDSDEGKSKDEAEFFALAIEQRAYPNRGDDQPQSLHEGDGSILSRGQLEPIRQVGKDGTQHGGNHSIDEDGYNGGEDQHAALLSIAGLECGKIDQAKQGVSSMD